jgi:hypothetical protein
MQSSEASTTSIKDRVAPADVDWGQVFRNECTNTSRIVQALVVSRFEKK